MADLTKTTLLGSQADAGVAITFTACVADVDQTSVFEPGDVLLAWNDGASSRTVTVYSAPEPVTGRLNNIEAESIAAHAIRAYGPFPAKGWKQSTGKLKYKANHADVKFAIIKGR